MSEEPEVKDMLDPAWTEEKGYSHLERLLEILARHELEEE